MEAGAEGTPRYDVQLQLPTASEIHVCFRSTADGQWPQISLGRQMLEIEIGLDRVEYALREGERLVIRHEMEEVELTRENPLIVRPVSRR